MFKHGSGSGSSSSSGSSTTSGSSSSITTSQALGAILSHLGGTTTTTATPTLTWTEESDTEEGYCGFFSRTRQWAVTDAPAGGVIIQRVSRAFSGVQRYDSTSSAWVNMSGSDIDGYIEAGSAAYGTLTQYWEAWTVDPGGNVAFGDGFSLCGIVPAASQILMTTRGQFVITGEARFYPTIQETALAGLGFSNLADHPANGLMASNSAPNLGSHVGYAAPNYTVTVRWDSNTTDEDNCYSDVTVS